MNVVPVMSAPSAKERARAAQEIQAGFDRDIQPLLEKYCYSCHGNGKHKETSRWIVSGWLRTFSLMLNLG